MRSTLIILSHLDDEVLSCAGLIEDRVKKGVFVVVLIVYGRKYNGIQDSAKQFSCAQEARSNLGYSTIEFKDLEEGEPTKVGYYEVLDIIEDNLRRSNPDEVIIPSARDMNQDHRFLNDICKIALRPANLGNVKTILEAYTYDTDLRRPNYFIPLTKESLEKKIHSIECYADELRETPHPRSIDNIVALHRVFGSYCGSEYAEGYDVVYIKE